MLEPFLMIFFRLLPGIRHNLTSIRHKSYYNHSIIYWLKYCLHPLLVLIQACL